MTTETKSVSLSAIREAVLDCHIASLEMGDGWWAVRVNTDGEVYRSVEASPCYSEDEYYDRRPHTVTVYATRGASCDVDLDAEREAADDRWFETEIPTKALREQLALAGLELDEDA